MSAIKQAIKKAGIGINSALLTMLVALSPKELAAITKVISVINTFESKESTMKTYKDIVEGTDPTEAISEATDIAAFDSDGDDRLEVLITQFSGGKERGKMLQIGDGRMGKFIQLNPVDAMKAGAEMVKWGKKNK
jgi:hypothetical protein